MIKIQASVYKIVDVGKLTLQITDKKRAVIQEVVLKQDTEQVM